ncbi:hypothetical protein J14TS2_50090 [Bacillus sp. J14TS2]|uniref:ABC transporter permease n=1 Tax=unclassified Bacillus (in: firmicutes) TaxID=185979 RepID=UPI001A963E13|nr:MULTISPECIES: ABC transporter permease [unclassified Bacillus (in: firmicutes)]MBO0995962.1 ABC transporter permease [Bacillus sp. SD088]GIN74534.1 hypothetical protein J14TS2_50090 [Bacillus sp. J14TS2]
MINYIKSENYRLLRKKSLYLTSVICFLLIAAAAFVLYYMLHYTNDFPYGTSSFFYTNVISSGTQIVLVSFLYNATLTGKDTIIIKQAVSFGISRSTIFWSKLMLTSVYFLLVCIIGIFLVIGLGETLFDHESQVLSHFFLASSNMLPLVMGGFVLMHTLKMLKFADVYTIIAIILLFTLSGDLFRLLLRPIPWLNELYQYMPSTLLSENLTDFMNQTTSFDYRCWITGIVLAVIALLIGARRFAKRNID